MAGEWEEARASVAALCLKLVKSWPGPGGVTWQGLVSRATLLRLVTHIRLEVLFDSWS